VFSSSKGSRDVVVSLITEEPLFETIDALSNALREALIDRDWL